MATLNELITALSFKVDSKSFENLSKMSSGIKMLQEGLETIGKKITGGKSLKELIFGTAKESTDLLNLSKNIGLSTDAIQKWQYAAKKAGLSASSVVSDVASLITQPYIRSEEAIFNLARKLQSASPQYAAFLKQKFGLSDDLFTLLKRGPEEIKKYMTEIQDAGGIISQEDLEKGDEFTKQLALVQESIEKTVKTIATEYMPTITQFMDKFSNWIKDTENQEKLITGIKIALEGLAAASIVGGISNLINVIKNLSGAIALLKGSMAFLAGPIGWAFLGLSGLGSLAYMLYDEYKRQGNMTPEEIKKMEEQWGDANLSGKLFESETDKKSFNNFDNLLKVIKNNDILKTGKRDSENNIISQGTSQLPANTKNTNIHDFSIYVTTNQPVDYITSELNNAFGIQPHQQTE